MKKYLRAWLSEDGDTLCWQYSHQYDYRSNSVRHWLIGNLVIYQWFMDGPIDSYLAHIVAESERTGRITIHRISLDFWQGENQWKRKKSR